MLTTLLKICVIFRNQPYPTLMDNCTCRTIPLSLYRAVPVFYTLFQIKLVIILFKEQPINIFICAEQIVHYFCSTFILLNLYISIPFGYSNGQLVNKFIGDFISTNTYCWIYFYITTLNVIFRGVNGLGMAMVRFLDIGRGNWVKRHEANLVFVALSVLLLSFGLIYLYGMENVSHRSAYNNCLGHTQAFQVIFFTRVVA